MRKTFVFFALIIFGVSLYSQQEITVTDSIISYTFSSPTDSSLYEKEYYSYDINGKTTMHAKYSWNSALVTWFGDWKNKYSFNSFGDISLRTSYDWDSDLRDWIEFDKYEYTYGSDSILDILTYYEWDSDYNDWAGVWKNEYSYDSNGHLILLLNLKWNSNDELVKFSKNEYANDIDGKRTFDIKYVWNSNTNDWLEETRTEFTYDPDGNLILWLYFNWGNSNGWVNSIKQESTYDSNENLILQVSYNWESSTNSWTGKRKNEYSYDLRGNQVLHIWYDYDDKKGWYQFRKDEYEYDDKGNETLHIIYDWDSDTNNWLPYYNKRKEFIYDSLGNISLVIVYDWDTLTEKAFYYKGSSYLCRESYSICAGDSILWQGSYLKTEGIYYENYISETGSDSIYEMTLTVNSRPDLFSITGENVVSTNQILTYSVPINHDVNYTWAVENGNIISYPAENSANIQWGNIGTGCVIANSINQYGCMSDTIKLVVEIGPTSISQMFFDKFKIYPNPISNTATIEFPNEEQYMHTIKILDLSGRVLKCINNITTSTVLFKREELSSGVYILELQGTITIRRKIVIK